MNNSSYDFPGSSRLACLLLALFFSLAAIHPAQASGISVSQNVLPLAEDVFVISGNMLVNPTGTCRVAPCPAGSTDPSQNLFSSSGVSLGPTWGQWQMASGSSVMQCKRTPDFGAKDTTVRLELSGLIPNSVYSIFYRTFGPDSINPFCPTEERSLVIPDLCTGANCTQTFDSKVLTDATGSAVYEGEISGLCVLNATQLFVDVIFHFDGKTWSQLPNHEEFLTQVHPCAVNTDCPTSDPVCTSDACQPTSCATNSSTCHVCISSFGQDAMRQMAIIQK